MPIDVKKVNCPQCEKPRLSKEILKDGKIEEIKYDKHTIFDKEFFIDICDICKFNNQKWVMQKYKTQLIYARANRTKIKNALKGEGGAGIEL